MMNKEQWQEEVRLGLTDLSFEMWYTDRMVDYYIAENNVLEAEIKKLKHELHFRRIIG
jgi:hypothetical protein